MPPLLTTALPDAWGAFVHTGSPDATGDNGSPDLPARERHRAGSPALMVFGERTRLIRSAAIG